MVRVDGACASGSVATLRSTTDALVPGAYLPLQVNQPCYKTGKVNLLRNLQRDGRNTGSGSRSAFYQATHSLFKMWSISALS